MRSVPSFLLSSNSSDALGGRARAARRHVLALAGAAAVLAAGAAPGARAQTVETVSFKPVGQSLMQGASVPSSVPAKLRLPAGDGPFPAVVVMHGSGGVDGRGEALAAALQAAGIASIEPDMWKARGLTGGVNSRARTVVDTLPDTWGAWHYLATHSKIAADRIGIAGFSWGGTLAWITAFGLKPLNSTPEVQAAKFAAHVPFYGSCTSFLPGARGATALQGYGGKPVGTPMLYVIGSKDDYEASASACQELARANPQVPMKVRVVEGATHGFDGSGSFQFFDPLARNGAGNQITITPAPEAAAQVRAEVVQFFSESLRK